MTRGPLHSSLRPSPRWSEDPFPFLAPVDAAIVQCLRLERDSAQPERAAQLLARCDSGALLLSARQHGVGPLLYGVLRRHGLGQCLAEEALAELGASRLHSAALDAIAGLELERLFGVARKAETRIMVVRGPLLARSVYSDPAERPYRDLDLVIDEECWPRFRSAMLELGYQPGRNDDASLPVRLLPQVGLDHYYEFTGPQGLVVEVKFDLLALGLRMRTLAQSWERARPIGASATGMRPSLEDELLMLCVHLNRHGFQRLLWLNDIALFLDRFGANVKWRALARTGSVEGVLPSIHYSLRLARLLLGAPVPDEALELTAPGRIPDVAWRSMWPLRELLAFEGGHERGLVFRKRATDPWLLGNLLMTGRTAEKAAYFARRVFPPPAFLAEKYGAGEPESYGKLLARRYAKAFQSPGKTEA